jgi:ATP-dependent protease HslVU (ClpYQ) peptidase subunit
MTCIAAIVQNGKVWMGGDSAGVDDGLGIVDCSESKVWLNNKLLFGAFGSFRVAQAVRFNLVVPAYDPEVDALEYMVGHLMDAMHGALEESGALSVWQDDSTVAMNESGLLVAVGGRLFEVFGDFGIGEYRDGFAAVGCGGPFAYGSLYSTKGQKPKQRIRMALKASERFSAGVRRPFTIIHT